MGGMEEGKGATLMAARNKTITTAETKGHDISWDGPGITRLQSAHARRGGGIHTNKSHLHMLRTVFGYGTRGGGGRRR